MTSGRYPAFVKGMNELGYVEGKDVVIEARYGDGNAARLATLAAELVQSNVDVIVTGGTPANRAAQKATKTIPIVLATSANPVGEGYAATLARPGGNVTGVTSNIADIEPKHLELLYDVVPKLSRVAVMWNPANSGHGYRVKALQAAALKLGMRTITVNADTPRAIEEGFRVMVREGAQAVVILNDSFFVQQERQITDLALNHRLPSVCALRSHPEAGGLMSYGPNTTDNFRRAASYVDKILKGAKAGDLPIQQPTRFDLVINMRTARVLGLAIPKTMVFQADRVIE